MNKEIILQKNKLIKKFMIFNLLLFGVLFIIGSYPITLMIALLILTYPIVLYFVIMKATKTDVILMVEEKLHEKGVGNKKRDLTRTELLAEIIQLQFFITVWIISFSFDLSKLVTLIILAPVVIFTIIIENEYQKNNKILKNSHDEKIV